jgi:hypothetical protein
MLKIIDVEYIEGYRLFLSFNNGETLNVDLEEHLDTPAFTDLKNLENFKQFGLVRGTLEWYNHADFAPEFLYKLAIQQNKIKTE